MSKECFLVDGGLRTARLDEQGVRNASWWMVGYAWRGLVSKEFLFVDGAFVHAEAW